MALYNAQQQTSQHLLEQYSNRSNKGDKTFLAQSPLRAI